MLVAKTNPLIGLLILCSPQGMDSPRLGGPNQTKLNYLDIQTVWHFFFYLGWCRLQDSDLSSQKYIGEHSIDDIFDDKTNDDQKKKTFHNQHCKGDVCMKQGNELQKVGKSTIYLS